MTSDAWALNAEDAVGQLYEALLGRPVDESGLADKAGRLRGGSADLKQIVSEILGSAEFRNASGADRFTRDCSQFGEIWLLLREMINAQSVSHYVVEVGARGRERSNSFDLMRHFGWRGLLIEANPGLTTLIESEFQGLDYKLINVAVSDYTGRAQFTIGINDDVSSLTAEAASSWGPTKGTIDVEVRRLPDILADVGVPNDFDLLSIDIEGEDIKVINDLIDTSAYSPRWVIIEASYDYRTKSLEEVGSSDKVCSSYRIFAQTPANLLLQRR